jgi:CRP-like cAMP-binding protein
VASLHSGDAFGEIALINRSTRTASAVCRTDCRLLSVDREDFDFVLKMAAEHEFQTKLELLRSCAVFRNMLDNTELRKLAELGHTKEYAQNVMINSDLENSEEIYFIRKGSCRLVQAVDFLKQSLPDDQYQLLPLYENDVAHHKLAEGDKIVSKLLVLNTLQKFQHFGGQSLSRCTTKRQALTEVFAKVKGKRALSVITSSKTECLLIKKVDFLRFATDEAFEQLRTELLAMKITPEDAADNFLSSRQWDQLKRDIIEELTQQSEKETDTTVHKWVI